MKAFIEKYKPAAVDLAKNLVYGVGTILALAFVLAFVTLVSQTSTGTVLQIAELMRIAIFAIALTAIGKFVRTKMGK